MKEGVPKNLNADELVIKTNERVRWTEELHEIFVAAALKLGPKAVPSKVLAEMKCTVLTRDQVASHLQNYRPILFGKEEDSKPKKQEQKTIAAATKRVEKRKKSSDPVTKESVKAAAPNKKQRATPVNAQQPKAAPVVSSPKPVIPPKQAPVVTVKPVVAAPVAPVVKQSSVAKEDILAPIPEPKKDFFLSMSSETNDQIIDQFFGDLDLLGTEFNHDSGIDNMYINATPVGDQFPLPSSSLLPSLAGRLDFDIIEEDRKEYASPLSDCGYVCSPPVIQSPPAESSIFAFDSWGSSEIQLELGEVEIETDGGLPSTEFQQLDSSKVEQDHSCWYCDSYTGITSFI